MQDRHRRWFKRGKISMLVASLPTRDIAPKALPNNKYR
jgi:hypothetical protein